MEKAYLTMKNSGASSITLGIIVLVVGVARDYILSSLTAFRETVKGHG